MTKYNWDERHIITFPEKKLALETKDLHVYYGQKEAIKGIDMQFEKNKITALIGPSGCGKSTFLRSLNRMNDTIDIAKVTGQILYQGVDVNASNINVYEMRKHIGMVFQRPNNVRDALAGESTRPRVSRLGEGTLITLRCINGISHAHERVALRRSLVDARVQPF